MTFPTPTTAGVFLSGLSDKIKSAITGDSVNHCLIGPGGGAGIWLRNNAGFHGALAKMADALLERAVLPYQITATLPSMSSLKDGNFTGSDEQPIQFLSKISLPPVLSNHLKRSRLGKEKRMAPLEFWNAILGSINELGRSSDVVMRSSIGEPVSDERYADAVIFPSCMRPMSWTAWWGGYSWEDITDSGWTLGSDWPWSYSSPVRFVYDVCRMSYVEDVPTMNMLSQMPFDFPDDQGSWYFYYWDFPGFPFIDYYYEYRESTGLYGMLSTQDVLRDKLCRSAAYLYNWGPNLSSRSNTARPNIDLLRMFQVLLGCFWANWAKLAVDIRVAHRTTEITYRYSVDFNGNVTRAGSPSSSSRISYTSNVLTWSHDVTWSASGEWSPTSHSELFSGSAEFCPDASDLVDPGMTAEIEAYSYEAEKARTLANLNDAKDAVRSQEIRDQLSDKLKQGFDYVDPYGRTVSGVSTEVRHGGIVEYGYPSSKEDCDDVAAAILDRLTARVEEIRYLGSCDVLIHIWFHGDISYHTQIHDIGALGVALNEMKEAYDDYQYALTDPGICKDISLELGSIGCEIEWDDEEPYKPGTVTLEATSIMTEPINIDDYEPRALIQTRGATSRRVSPWPARVLFNEGYVGSMDVAFGGRICDRLVYGCGQNNSGFYSVRNGGLNYVSERTPTEKTFRRLLFDSAAVASNVEAPSEAVESIVGLLIDDPNTHIVGAAGLGGHLPLVQYAIFPRGTPGVAPSSTPEQAACAGVTACYHPTKSPKVYYNPTTGDSIISDGGSVPSGYSFLGYGPWRILDSGGNESWKYEAGGSLCFSIGFDYTLDGHSQTARVEEPPYDDELTVDLSRHIAVRAVWNWKSMPVQL